MPDAYAVHDAQYLQFNTKTSAADALFIASDEVPVGKVWTVRLARVYSSATETQDYWFAVYRLTKYFPITTPQSATVNSGISRFYPALREGMEIKLYPGEKLVAHRAAATASSTITIDLCFYETDLQYYIELDKHKVLRRRSEAMQESNPMGSSGGSVSAGRAATGGRTRGIFTRFPR